MNCYFMIFFVKDDIRINYIHLMPIFHNGSNTLCAHRC